MKPKLSPSHPVTLLDSNGVTRLTPGCVTAARVGLKAVGLAALPEAWTPQFFVVGSSFLDGSHSEAVIQKWLNGCLAGIAGPTNELVMVRSSGVSETIAQRGRLPSEQCRVDEVVKQIVAMRNKVLGEPTVHWIVQRYVGSEEKGHLSNERHLSRENRDWVLERGGLRSDRFGVRAWRDGATVSEAELRCRSVDEVTVRLRQVAMWATRFSSRIHFEWIRSSAMLYIVQADVADSVAGVDPRSLLPDVIPTLESSPLRLFRVAVDTDFLRYPKLENARVYRSLGYELPAFFVLDDTQALELLKSGNISRDLACDLVNLTRRPLVIRTDGVSVPTAKREMLPRSDELRSIEDAKDWLLNAFKKELECIGLRESELCLIAHHFIPSVASAWARAEPGKRVVRIESLWGIPEGLYWYSHDTYEVDTRIMAVENEPRVPKCRIWKRRRFKGAFIAPNQRGRWIRYQTAAPHDWRLSISKDEWLFEMAWTTRRIAEREKNAVSVMWFVDNHPDATGHSILPWFHSASQLDGSPKAAPRNKRKDTRDSRIECLKDWADLKESAKPGLRTERVIVDPVDPELVRNPGFTKELAKFAAEHNLVIELSGGLLSHVYYLLQKNGAQVECVDLFGAEDDVVEYDKLVRDKVPATIRRRGEQVSVAHLVGDALILALRQKLVEEAVEALDAASGPSLIEELADVQEVVRALSLAVGSDPADVENERCEKERARGGFDHGTMLVRTIAPHSIPGSETGKLGLGGVTEHLISNPSNLPVKSRLRRPDYRRVNDQPEKQLAFELEFSALTEIMETLNFSTPMERREDPNFTVTVELRRRSNSIRVVVRLREERQAQLGLFPAEGRERD